MKYYLTKIKDAAAHLPELLIVFFSPAWAQICVVGLAVVADTITGLWAAKRTGEKINSKRLYDFVPKCIVYIVFVLLAHGIEIVFQINHARTLVAVALVAMELMSCDENFKRATGKSIFKPIIALMKKK